MSNQINSFEEYGRQYQLQLFNEMITDHKFGLAIIDILEPTYFQAEVFSRLCHLIKGYYQQHEVLFNYEGLRTEISMQLPGNPEDSTSVLRQQILHTVDEIQKCPLSNLNVQKKALNFCRFRRLQKTFGDIKVKIDKNLVEEYEVIEDQIKECFNYREIKDPVGVMDDVDSVLDDESREPIPTGIDGIDTVLHGGLSKGELAMVIAPLGVGKTTYLTKVANTAYKAGKNVLQIFFEDKVPSVQRKHYTAFTGIPLNELAERKDEVKRKLAKVSEDIREYGNHLHLVKMPADGVTVTKIKNEIKRINSKFPKIDLLIIDYLDCISADKVVAGQEDWSNEGKITRQLEVMIEEMQVACWTATQGARSSTSIEVVKVDNMGGNLKKAQIAHFIMSIGKTLEQKEMKVATISILKNRMGDDGMIFSNCKFDNSTMTIDTGDVLSEKGFEEQNAKKNGVAASAAIKAYREAKYANPGGEDTP
jgi:replicative DNA helicase